MTLKVAGAGVFSAVELLWRDEFQSFSAKPRAVDAYVAPHSAGRYEWQVLLQPLPGVAELRDLYLAYSLHPQVLSAEVVILRRHNVAFASPQVLSFSHYAPRTLLVIAHDAAVAT